MPRVYKFSKFLMKLYVPHASEMTDLTISLYTTNYEIATEFTQFKRIDGNVVELIISAESVCNMDNGLIKYKFQGYINGDFYSEERQSDYMLKSPSDFAASGDKELELPILAANIYSLTHNDEHIVAYASDYDVEGWEGIEIDIKDWLADEKRKVEEYIINDKLVKDYTIYRTGIHTPPKDKVGFANIIVLPSPDGVGAFEMLFEKQLIEIQGEIDDWNSHMDDRIRDGFYNSSQGIMYCGAWYDGQYIGSPVVSRRFAHSIMHHAGPVYYDLTYTGIDIPLPNNSLVKPWVYTEGNSLGTEKICPEIWLGGFYCEEVEYIKDVFENAGELRYIRHLRGLGASFNGSHTLDFSPLNFEMEGRFDLDAWANDYGFLSIRDVGYSVYNFVQSGMNKYGIDHAHIKFPKNTPQELKDLWAAKGWYEIE